MRTTALAAFAVTVLATGAMFAAPASAAGLTRPDKAETVSQKATEAGYYGYNGYYYGYRPRPRYGYYYYNYGYNGY